MYKRVFFLKTMQERQHWRKAINEAARNRKVEEEYEVTTEVIG